MAQVLGDLGERSLEALRRSFTGPLITPADAAYDDARSIWNGAIDRRPVVIAQCLSTDDVATAVSVARDSGIHPAVRTATAWSTATRASTPSSRTAPP